MAKSSNAGLQRALIVQASVTVGVIAIAVLYLAQVVFVPLALGVFLTFLLTPVVSALERRGLGRTTAVVATVTLSGLMLALVIWTTTVQVMHLAEDLPSHTEKVKAKVNAIQNAGRGGVFERLQMMFEDIQSGRRSTDSATAGKTAPAATTAEPANEEDEPGVAWISKLPGQLGTFLRAQIGGLMEPLGAIALAVILAIFMLLQREDLRNRFLKLVGNDRITTTTRAFDETGARISRYLLMQLIVNGTYGLAWAFGLLLIGVDYALLWGFLAAMLRYIPYLGGPIAAALPVMLSVVEFDGWTRPAITIAYLVLLELVSNNVMEPWLYGKSMGVSSVAQIVAATFWAFLWGPIGLVLSSPLTVCLLVLGRHVKRLNFLTVLLGDEPALAPPAAFYQRLLAKDEEEALVVARQHAATVGRATVFDDVVVPALVLARRGRADNLLSRAEEREIFDSADRIIENIATEDLNGEPADTRPASAPAAIEQVRAIMCAAHDQAETTYLRMLQQDLAEKGCGAELISSKHLPTHIEARIRAIQPAVVVIGILPPGGVEQARFLCKRLRKAFPDLRIVVAYGAPLRRNYDKLLVRMRAAGASIVVTSLALARDQVLAATGSEAPPKLEPAATPTKA